MQKSHVYGKQLATVDDDPKPVEPARVARSQSTTLTAPTPDALALQRPLPDGALKIVARGDRTGDGLAA